MRWNRGLCVCGPVHVRRTHNNNSIINLCAVHEADSERQFKSKITPHSIWYCSSSMLLDVSYSIAHANHLCTADAYVIVFFFASKLSSSVMICIFVLYSRFFFIYRIPIFFCQVSPMYANWFLLKYKMHWALRRWIYLARNDIIHDILFKITRTIFHQSKLFGSSIKTSLRLFTLNAYAPLGSHIIINRITFLLMTPREHILYWHYELFFSSSTLNLVATWVYG